MTALLNLNLIAEVDKEAKQARTALYQSREELLNYVKSRFYWERSILRDVTSPHLRLKIDDIASLMFESGLYGKNENPVKDLKLLNAYDSTYNPLKPKLFYDNTVHGIVVNSYTPPATNNITPTAEFKQLWDSYMALLCREKEDRPLLESWLAWQVQKPTRTKLALLLYGSSGGVGKGTLQTILTHLHGADNVHKPADSAQFMLSRFKSELEKKTLLVLDELYSEGFKVANIAKSLITEDSLAIEGKGENQRTVTPYFDVMAASNKVQPIWLESNDRRWLCFNVEHDNPQVNASHPDNRRSAGIVRTLQTLLNDPLRVDETIAMIRHILSAYDLSSFDPHAGVRHTKDTMKLISNSASLNQDTFQSAWDSNAPEELYFNANEWFERNIEKQVTPASRANMLSKVGCVQFSVTNDGRERQLKLDKHDNSKNGKRGWWITPKGLEAGIYPEMKLKQILQITTEYEEDIINDREEYEQPITASGDTIPF